VKRPKLAWLLLLALLCGPVVARVGDVEIETDPPSQGEYLNTKSGAIRFSVATYNVRARPLLDEIAPKFRAMAPLLNAFDIVALQECFSEHRLLWRGVTHPVRVYDGSRTDWLRLASSGLCTLSRLPLRKTLVEKFEQPEGLNYLFRAKKDGLASKGIMLTRFDLGSCLTLDFYNTHMEAGSDTASNELRRRQTLQLIDMVRKHSPREHAVILAGDFNMRQSGQGRKRLQGQYPRDLEGLDRWELFGVISRELGLTNAASLNGGEDGALVDHILYRSGTRLQLAPVAWKRDTQRFIDPAGQSWSDHDPIITTFRANRVP